MQSNRRQVAGNHYAATIQHWDYVLLALNGRYLEGNITKYVCRHRKKNGLQDLEKAMHYLDKLEESVKAGWIEPNRQPPNGFDMAGFISSNGLNTFETFIVKRLAYWYRVDQLDAVRREIQTLMEYAREAQRRSDAVKAGFHIAEEAGSDYVNQG